MNSGVYIIENKINHKRYIGSSANLKTRLYDHNYLLCHGNHPNKHLQSSFNKYGAKNFEFMVILYCEPSKLMFHEQSLINRIKPEYNLRSVQQSKLKNVTEEDKRGACGLLHLPYHGRNTNARNPRP